MLLQMRFELRFATVGIGAEYLPNCGRWCGVGVGRWVVAGWVLRVCAYVLGRGAEAG